MNDTLDMSAKASQIIAIVNEILERYSLTEKLTKWSYFEEIILSIANSTSQRRSPEPTLSLPSAQRLYEDRRRRGKIFGSEAIFGEPAWDILLDLFIALEEDRRVSVKSACIGAAVPSTTALRWISVLASQGLIMRENDPDDGRRSHIALSPVGHAAMIAYFDAASRKAPFG